MYRCEFCKKLVPPQTPARRIVVETREAHYPRRDRANRPAPWKKQYDPIDDPGGTGREIVREQIACPRCADQR